MDVVNLDPHADCRNVAEGRHSGNGFSTAFGEGLIRKYFLCGYHNRYNSQACNQAFSLASVFRCVHRTSHFCCLSCQSALRGPKNRQPREYA